MKILGYILLFFTFFIAFLPQENIFFKLQNILAKEKIFLNVNTIKENPFSLSLNKINVYYKDINISNINNIDILMGLFFNKISSKDIKINFQNLKINYLNIDYALYNPLNILLQGKANFGNIKGYINLKNQKGKIYILDLKNTNLQYFLKKDKKGYFYEISY